MNAVASEGSKEEGNAKNSKPQTETAGSIRPNNVEEDGGIVNKEESEGYECQDCNEGMNVKIARMQEMPSKEELEAHNASHVPYRSWCPHCVKDKQKRECMSSRIQCFMKYRQIQWINSTLSSRKKTVKEEHLQ